MKIPFQIVEKIESTHDHLVALAKNPKESEQILIANQQSKGHGQYSRTWQSPPGNFYCSAIIYLTNTSKNTPIHLLPLAYAVHWCEYFRKAWKKPVQVRWPNDLILENGKCGGILAESITCDDHKYIKCVISIGVNINTAIENETQKTSALNSSPRIPVERWQHSLAETTQIILERITHKDSCFGFDSPQVLRNKLMELHSIQQGTLVHWLSTDENSPRTVRFQGFGENLGLLMKEDNNSSINEHLSGSIRTIDKKNPNRK